MNYFLALLPLVVLALKTIHKDDGKTFTNAPAAVAGGSAVHTSSSRHKSLFAATGGLNEEQKQAVVAKHNALRGAQNEPCTATDMTELVWDNALAAESQDYSAKCVWAHDTRNMAKDWGENLAYSGQRGPITTETGVDFIQLWYNEIKDTAWDQSAGLLTSKNYANPKDQCQSYDPGTQKCMTGHYTQLVWAKSTRVGCGVSVCDSGLGGSGGLIFVCKYGPAGNYGSAAGTQAPYTCGAACASCKDTCKDNLCPDSGAGAGSGSNGSPSDSGSASGSGVGDAVGDAWRNSMERYQQFNLDFAGGGAFEVITAIVLMVIGFGFLFWGSQFFKATLFLVAFFFGASLAYFIVMQASPGSSTAAFVVALVAGVLFGSVAIMVLPLSFFILGAACGVVLWLTLKALFPDMLSTPVSMYVVLALLIIICGLVAVKLEKFFIILGTPLIGAFMFIQGIDYFVEDVNFNIFQLLNFAPCPPGGAAGAGDSDGLGGRSTCGCTVGTCYALYAMVLVLWLLGVFVQYRYTSEIGQARRKEKSHVQQGTEMNQNKSKKKPAKSSKWG